MKMTFRWYGETDSIPLSYIKQIPNMSGVVTAIYDTPVGQKWSDASVARLKSVCDEGGLEMEVIESIPVHEDIKLGLETRDEYIENYCENLRTCAKYGVKCVCYNFMPVFDWLRTNLDHINADGSSSLSYSKEEFDKLDPNDLHLPGWDESYSPVELQELLASYKKVTHDMLFDNMVYFLKKIIPTAEAVGINMAIHPDDPPWDIFGLPRIVSTEADIDRMFAAVPSKNNGLTLCTGSFGAGRSNDLIRMADKFSAQGRLHFLHLRNVLWTDDKDSFCEVAHNSAAGSVDMYGVARALVANDFDGYVRPDHGRNIFGEKGKPGYGLFDRALGSAYINGLFEAAEKELGK